ncbi:hypothetical protein [Absidia glauca]|uniref:B30.2/SPRY domain-containing protein n=1 Tax=Absidia glauca TaxID=4829 RepID=A0A168M029_ABSGL|nr:hypothetical protein [Absidia glauca]
MEWNNLYVIIIIALVFVLVIGLMFLLPKLLAQESTHDHVSSGPFASLLAPYSSRKQLKQVKAWQRTHPPITDTSETTTSYDWRFETLTASATIIESDTLIFLDHAPACSLMTRSSLPLSKPIIYWEATMVELTQVAAVGLSTKPYPSWRLPGWHQHSIAYHSHNGCVSISNPSAPTPYSAGYKKDDVIGVGYLSQTNTIFFTKNGRNLGRAITGFKFPIYPIVGAIGRSKIAVNFGQQAFRYDLANEHHAGLIDELFSPPPTYGVHLRDTLLFDQPPPPMPDDNDTVSIPLAPLSSSSPPPQYPSVQSL